AQILDLLRDLLARTDPALAAVEPSFRDFRPGDVRHSLADISHARMVLGYAPSHRVGEGLAEAIDWYVDFVRG
ncbi:MAG: LPS biosynthesis protein WbpP, partial [Gammaproteobacteria bacterium]